MFLVLDNAHMERFYWAWNCIKLDFRKRLNPAGMGIESSQGWNQERLWVLQSTSSLNTLDFHLKFLWILNYRASCWGRKMLSNQSVKVVKQCAFQECGERRSSLNPMVGPQILIFIPHNVIQVYFSNSSLLSSALKLCCNLRVSLVVVLVSFQRHLFSQVCMPDRSLTML